MTDAGIIVTLIAKALSISAESLARMDELPELGGCEAAIERAWHDGRLSTLKALGLVDVRATGAVNED